MNCTDISSNSNLLKVCLLRIAFEISCKSSALFPFLVFNIVIIENKRTLSLFYPSQNNTFPVAFSFSSSCWLTIDLYLIELRWFCSLLHSRFQCLHATLLPDTKTLFTWSGGPRSSGVGFFCFHALWDTKQKKPTPLNRGPPLHVKR